MRTFMEWLSAASWSSRSLSGYLWSDRRVRDGLLGARADIFNHVCHPCSDESKIPIDRIGCDWGFGDYLQGRRHCPRGAFGRDDLGSAVHFAVYSGGYLFRRRTLVG